jgi:multidrug efflux pump
MLMATFVAIFFIPLFYKLLARDRKKPAAAAPQPPQTVSHGGGHPAPAE